MTQLNSRVNPPVGLEPEGIALNEGLDLTTNNLQINKGALRDCLNFEVVDRLGYQTISGFDRYSGALSPDQLEFYVMRYTPATDAITIQSALFGPSGTFIGVAVATGSDMTGEYVVFARSTSDDNPEPTNSFTSRSFGTSVVFSHMCDTAPVSYVDSFLKPVNDTAGDIFGDFETWNDLLRGRIRSLPNVPHGLHWFRDRLYAVCDQQQIVFTNGDTEILPNMYVRPTSPVDYCGRVLDVTVTSGTYGAGTAAGVITVEPVTFFQIAETLFSVSPPQSGDVDLLENQPDVSNWNDPANTIATSAFIAAPVTANTPDVEIAGLWRDGQEDNPRWSNIDTGWQIPFENGFSFSNALRKVERSLDNNFVFATANEEGLPARFGNGVNLPDANSTPLIRDANGWYASTDFTIPAFTSAAVEADDGDYLCGDIDFGFDRLTGRVERIGNNGGFVTMQSIQANLNKWFPIDIDNPTTGTTNAGTFSARTPLAFTGLGPILALIPRDAQISGLEIELKVKNSFGGFGKFNNTTYPVIGDLQDEIAQYLTTAFRAVAQFGKFDNETVVFTPISGSRNTPLTIPDVGSSYTYDTSYVTPPGFTTFKSKYIDPSDSTITIGSSTDLFGLQNISRDTYEDPNFGFVLYGDVFDTTANAPIFSEDWQSPGANEYGFRGALRFSIDQIILRIYYDEPSARYYVKESATKVLSFDLINYVITEGSFQDGTAKGILQVNNVTSVGTGADYKPCALVGDEIYLDSTLTRKVGDISGTTPGDVAMTSNGLPSLSQITEAGSRYQFITANFFAREDWDGFYGVSGAGQAFSFASFDADDDGFDEDYLQKIFTNTLVVEEDKPRHVAFHQYHLALGFRDGTVRFSVAGEPENYSGELGAAEVGVGDRVTGLLAMRGKALGVFCEQSIYTILGANVDEFQVETLAPSTGAIEYTVVDMGIPLYCDNRGISTLEQSQKYGNFVGIRMSQKVSPWLRPRLTRSDNLLSLGDSPGVVCAIPVRSKNQYRVFFRDGNVLTLTINGDMGTAFSFSKYYLNEDEDQFFAPIAHSSEVDVDGKERIHMAHYSPNSTISASDSMYVYEFERGLGFDGDWFDAWFETAFYYVDPFKYTKVKKARADGLTKGYGLYTIQVGKDYEEDSYSDTLVSISLPRPEKVPATIYTENKPATTMANVAREGRCLSYRIARDQSDKTLTPPVVYQVLLVQYEAGGRGDT